MTAKVTDPVRLTGAEGMTGPAAAVIAAAAPVKTDPVPVPVPPPTATVAEARLDAAYEPRAAMAAADGTATGDPVNLPAETVDPVLHLARRASWGATPELLDEIRAMGTTKWLDAQLNPTKLVRDTAMDQLATRWTLLNLQVWEYRDSLYPNSSWSAGTQAIQAYLARAIWSKRQLLEVMVDFWTNHLVVSAPNGDAWDSAHHYHVNVIRKHALGRYADMLVASAKHPAMLAQLDNSASTKRAPNENYGRELLELHTVGIDGGYAESDIRISALALTGISTEGESGEYLYKPIRHHVGPLALMGWSHPNRSANGEDAATSYLVHLARHPKTARRLATKLARRFVADFPPASLVDRLASTYLANDTAIAPVLRVLFTSPEFANSGAQKVKRPLEDIVSTVRILGFQPGQNVDGYLNDLAYYGRITGQAPMWWPAPDGYPDTAGAYSGAGASLGLWNYHMSQAWAATNDRITVPPLRQLLPGTLPGTYGGYVDALAARLLHAPLSAAKRQAVCTFLDKLPTDVLKSTDAAVGWRLPYVVALLLDSPEFTKR